MIGRRSLLVGVSAALLVVILCNIGRPGPEAAVGADRLVAQRATAADSALATLEDQLRPALDAARAGGGRVIAGDELPGPAFLEAAGIVTAATDAAEEARAACAELGAALRARVVDAPSLPPCPDPREIASLAGQLGTTASAGDAFAEVRLRAEHVTMALDTALRALDAGDVEAAASAVDEARSDHDAVVALEPKPVTLPLWIETTNEMIGAVERVIEATREGDVVAADEAAAEFAALADDATTADRALRIAIGEGGGGVTAPALAAFASILGDLRDLRAAVATRGGPA